MMPPTLTIKAESDESAATDGGVIHTLAIGSTGNAHASAAATHASGTGSEIKTCAISNNTVSSSTSSMLSPLTVRAEGGSASSGGVSITLAGNNSTFNLSIPSPIEERALSTVERENLRKTQFSVPQVADYFLPTRHSEKLKQLFEAGATKVAITGIAGSGKTELAKYYAHSLNASVALESKAIVEDTKRVRSIASTIFYLEADPAVLETSLWNLAKVLNLPPRIDKETCLEYFKRASGAIPKAFSNYSNTLLILNNVSNRTEISYLLEALQDAPIRLVITTQQHDFFTAGKTVHNLNIGVGMSASEGLRLLQDIVPNLEPDGVEAFIHEVDGLPLALSLVGLYMCRERITNIKTYQKEAERVAERLRLEIAGLAEGTRYKRALHTVLVSIIEKISASSDAFELLVFASMVHPEGIPEVFFRDYLKAQEMEEKSAADSVETRLFKSLKCIKAYGLLKSHTGSLEARQYNMHRVVQAEVRTYYKNKLTVPDVLTSPSAARLEEMKQSKEALNPIAFPKSLGRMLTVINQNLPLPLLAFPLQAAPLVLHLEDALAYMEQLLGSVKDEVVCIAYHILGLARQRQGGTDNLLEALNYYKKALPIRHALGDQNTRNIAILLDSLGTVYSMLSGRENLERARNYHEQAVKIRKTIVGDQHPEVAASLNNLGTVYFYLGGHEDLEQACDYYEQALKIRQMALGDQHSDVALSLNNLGNVCSKLGGRENLEKARGYHEKALKIQKAILGNQHSDVALSFNNLGIVYFYLGGCKNLEQARNYHEKALEIRKVALGDQHPDVAASFNNLGIVYIALGSREDLGKACGYLEQALKIRKMALGEQHPDVAASLDNLGIAYVALGSRVDLEKARDCLEQALRIQKMALGDQHPNVAVSLNNLGEVCSKLGGKINLQQGLEYYKQALAIREKQLGFEHPSTIKIRNHLVFIQTQLNALRSFKLKAVLAASLSAVGFFSTGGIGGLAAGAVVGIGTPVVVEKARSCCARPKRD